MKSLVEKWYGKKKNIELNIYQDNELLKKWEKIAIGYFPPNAKVLDIGCGSGREAFALTESGFNVTGIDISKKAVKMAKKLSKEKGLNIKFMAYNEENIPFEDNSFDVIIIWSQTFGLIYNIEDRFNFLKECNRILRNNGILSLSTHDYEYLKSNYDKYMQGRKFFPYNGNIYWQTYTIAELKDYCIQSNFEILLCEKGEIFNHEDGNIIYCICDKSD